MNANDVIDSYVRDVAACLPRRMRGDVAFELRALLADELAGKAQAAGRSPDKAMALDLLKGFGRPAEAARRYHERPAIIDPADTHHFLIWTLAGAVGIVVLSMLDREGTFRGGDVFLQWLGLLLIFFSLAAWWRRRNPGKLAWKPNRGPDHMHWALSVFSSVMTLIFPVFMYAAPELFVETAFLGAFPGDVVALTAPFAESPLRWATLTLLVASAALYLVPAVQGGWRAWSYWAGLALNTALAATFLAHTAPMASADGRTFAVFVGARANEIADPLFATIGAMYVLSALYNLYRIWTRVPAAPALKTA